MIVLRAVAAASNSSTPYTVNKPVGTLTGELMIMEVASNGIDNYMSAPPADWQAVGNSDLSTTGRITLYYKYATAGEPSTYNVTCRATTLINVAIATFYDDLGGTVRIGDVQKQLNASSATRTYPSVTPTTASDMLCCFGHYVSTSSTSPTAGMTEQWDIGGSIRLYFMNQTLASISATGTRTVTGSITISGCVSLILTVGAEVKPSGPFLRPGDVLATASGAVGVKTIPVPSRLQLGDMMILQAHIAAAGITPSAPAGWTAVPNGAITGANSIFTFWKTAVAADITLRDTAGSYSVTFSGTQNIALGIAMFYSPRGYSLVIEDSQNSDNTVASTVQTYHSVTTANTITALALCMIVDSAIGSTPPDDEILLYDTGTAPRMLGGFSRRYAAGVQGPFSHTTISSTSRTVTIALAEVGPPDPPGTLLAVKIDETSIALTWHDNSSSEDGFIIEHSTNGTTWAALATVGANVTSYNHTGVAEHSLHYYRVCSYRSISNSTFSNTASATTNIYAPTAFNATVISDSQIDLTWTDNSGVEDNYAVQRSFDGITGWFPVALLGANITIAHAVNLNASTLYYFRVRAIAGSDSSDFSSVISATTNSNAPTTLVATPISDAQIDLTWVDNATTETDYHVERSLDGTTGWTEIAALAANAVAYSDTGRSEGTHYYYRVRSRKSGVDGAYSSVANAITKLKAPTSLVANAISPSRIDLAWTDISVAEDGFKIERSPDGTGSWTQIDTTAANVTTYSNTGLTASTPYFYRVRSYNAVAASDYSNIDNATTGAVVGLFAPINLAAVVISSNEIDLTWTDNNTGEDGYVLEIKEGIAGAWGAFPATAPNATGQNLTVLDSDTLYYFRVRAFIGASFGPYSDEVSATTLPAHPTSLVATGISPTRIDLTWVNNAIGDSVLLILIERSPDGTTAWVNIASLAGGTTTYSDTTGLADFTTYYYRVRNSVVGGGHFFSAYSNIDDGKTLLAAPVSLVATSISLSHIDLTWTDVSVAETGYKIERSPNGTGSWTQINTVGANVTSYSDTGLASLATFYYRVRANNGATNSDYSNVSGATTSALVAPANLAATPITASQIDLAWTDTNPNEDGYKVEQSFNNTTWTQIASLAANATTYSVTGLSQNQLSYYRVRAFLSGDFGAYSAVASGTTLLATPTGLAATPISDSRIDLSWVDNSVGEADYRVERSPNGTGSWAVIASPIANATTYSDTTGLTDGTRYWYRVRSHVPGSFSEYSAIANALTALKQPTSLVATATSANQISLTWLDVSGAEEGYRIERSPDGSGSWTEIAVVGPNVTSYVDVGLSGQTNYYYRIRAYQSPQYSGYSGTAHTATSPVLPGVTMSLSQYTAEGCPERFHDGALGQVVIQGAGGPQWSGPAGIAIADVGGYFTTDNVEAALQQLGAGAIFSCEAIQDCVGAGFLPQFGLAFQDGPNLFYFSGESLPTAPTPLPADAKVIVTRDGVNLSGSQASFEAIALAVAPFIGGVAPSCPAVISCVRTVISPLFGLSYFEPDDLIYFSGDTLEFSATTLPPDSRVIITNDGLHSHGSQATYSQLALALAPFFGENAVAGQRPFNKIGGALQLLSSDNVLYTDSISHSGKVVLSGSTITSTNAALEVHGNSAISGQGHNFTGTNSIAGGVGNTVATSSLTVGDSNVLTGTNQVAFGYNNHISNNDNFVAGNSNTVSSNFAAVTGGTNNRILVGPNSFIGGGQNNTSSGDESVIGAGTSNTIAASCTNAGIFAGLTNTIAGPQNVIITGENNIINNLAANSVIVAGKANTLFATYAFIGAGQTNQVRGLNSAIVAGFNNIIDPKYIDPLTGWTANNSFIGAGQTNHCVADTSGIVAGSANTVNFNSPNSFIGAGASNYISTSARSVIVGGNNNQIAGGNNNFIGGGILNQINSFGGNQGSVALGTRCIVEHTGSFLWQSNTGSTDWQSARDGEVAFRSAGGFRFRSNAAGTIGADMAPGGNSWVTVSDARLKGMFKQVNPLDLLERLRRVPINTYHFLCGQNEYHDQVNIGATAQDWDRQFGDLLGAKTVSNVVDGELVATPAISEGDKIGVLMATIQALAAKIEMLEKRIAG